MQVVLVLGIDVLALVAVVWLATRIGRHLVESMLEPDPSPYVRSLSPDRFTEQSWDWSSARQQAQHYYETYYCLGH